MKKWRDLGLFDAGGEVWDCVVTDGSCEAQGGERYRSHRRPRHGGPGTQVSCLQPRGPELCRGGPGLCKGEAELSGREEELGRERAAVGR